MTFNLYARYTHNYDSPQAKMLSAVMSSYEFLMFIEKPELQMLYRRSYWVSECM